MTNPVAVYDFDGNMNDSLGFGATLGNLNGYVPGKLGDGVGWGSCNNNGPHKFDFLLSPAGGAVCLWYKVEENAIGQGETMLQILQEDGNSSLSLEIGSNGTHVLVEAGYGVPGAGRVRRVAPLSPGWHHFAWSWSNGKMLIYVDGLQHAGEEDFSLFTTPGLVGQSEGMGLNYGVADQLCIFNGPASQAVFQQIYNAGNGRPWQEFVVDEPPTVESCCDSPNRAAEGVAGDEIILSPVACSLWVNSTGNLHVVTAGGDDVTLFVQAGTEVKLKVQQVREDSTASVVAFWKE